MFSLWIVIPVAVFVVIFVLCAAIMTFLMVFAEYFARGPTDGADFIDKPIRGEQLSFEYALRRSWHTPPKTAQSHGASLTRRTG